MVFTLFLGFVVLFGLLLPGFNTRLYFQFLQNVILDPRLASSAFIFEICFD